MFYLTSALLRQLFLHELLADGILTGEDCCLFSWETVKQVWGFDERYCLMEDRGDFSAFVRTLQS